MIRWQRVSALVAAAVCCVLTAVLPTAAGAASGLTVTCQLNGQTVVSGYNSSATRLRLSYFDSRANYGPGDWQVDLQPPPNAPYSNLTPTDTDGLGLGVASVTATITYPPINRKKLPRTVTTNATCS